MKVTDTCKTTRISLAVRSGKAWRVERELTARIQRVYKSISLRFPRYSRDDIIWSPWFQTYAWPLQYALEHLSKVGMASGVVLDLE